MSTKKQIVLIEDGVTFSPYYFYTIFLEKIAKCFNSKNEKPIISYKLTDDNNRIGKYRIDPISLPLLLSLTQQLKKNQNSAIEMELSNHPATLKLLEFLYRSDFFYVVGDNDNPIFPVGKNLLLFDDCYIGGFSKGNMRPEHKIRCYSLDDDPYLKMIYSTYKSEEEKRDYLISSYSINWI